MRPSRLLPFLVLLVLPALNGHAQFSGLPTFLARFMGENGLNLNLSRSTPSGSVTVRANLTSTGGSYSATVTAPSGSSMSVSGTATNLSANGGSFSGTISSSQGPAATYAGSIAVSAQSVDLDASVSAAGDDSDAAPQAPAQISMRVSTPAGNGAPGATFSGSVTSPQGAPASYSGSVAIGADSVEVSSSFTPSGGTTVSRTMNVPLPAMNPPAEPEDAEETPLQKILQRLGVIRGRG